MRAAERPILIAGGGPVGCIAALALARAGLPVHVFEAQPRVNDSPRAATTHAATLEMLAELGLVDEVMRRGLIEPKFRIWDRASREVIAEFDFGVRQRACAMLAQLFFRSRRMVRAVQSDGG